MKKFILTTGLLATLTVAANSQSPDIIIDSKLDYDFSTVLLKKFKTLCQTFNLPDPFTGRFSESILLNESKVSELLPADSKALIRDFGNAVGLNILNGETKIWMHGLAYDVKGFKTDLKAGKQDFDGLTVNSDISAEEIDLRADKISLGLVIPGKNNSPVFNVDIIRPRIVAQEDQLINFALDLKIQDYNEFFKLNIKKANFDRMAKGLISNSRSVDLTYEKIIIPKVSLKIGNKTVNFSPEKIEALIRRNHSAIKGILLAQAAEMLQSNTTQSALKVVENFRINKDYWLKAPVFQGKISLGQFTTSGENDGIRVNLPGDFCTNESFNQYKDQCVNNKKTLTSVTRLTGRSFQNSLAMMNDLTVNENANIVVSVSEDYLNKLLATAHDAGLLKTALDEAGVTLGPNKIVMRLDKKGETATLIMDVIYKPSKMEKLITGSAVIRFPLVLDLSVRIEKQDESPVIFVRLNDVDTSDETLIQGRPDQGMYSTVKDVPRFQGKVAKAIREKISVLRAKDLFELKYPELKGMDLDKIDFLSDGNGRMNAIVRLDDLLESR